MLGLSVIIKPTHELKMETNIQANHAFKKLAHTFKF